MKRSAFLLPLCLVLSACNATVPPTPVFEWPSITVLGADEIRAASGLPPSAGDGAAGGTDNPTGTESRLSDPPPYTVLYESYDTLRGMYEPTDGCYLAAQLDAYGLTDRETTAFNNRMGKDHAVFIHEMRLGDAFPEEWALGCVAAQAAPLLILHPTGGDAVFSGGALTELASALGAYNLPMFVVFFPLVEGHRYDAATYGLYFRYARAIFAEYAPKAAFVWAVDARVSPAGDWYPGHEAVDWVGMTVADSLSAADRSSLSESFDAFYMTYQREKPVMLTQLAISHFSAQDYTYRTQAAAEELVRWYTRVRDEYPRVRLLGYKDINEMRSLTAAGGQNDFSISTDELLTDTYRQLIQDRLYLSMLETSVASERAVWLRSAYPGRYIEGCLQLEAYTIKEEVKGGFFTTVDHDKRLAHVFLQ